MSNWVKGVSGNPAGRPKGAKGNKTIAIETIVKVMERYRDKFESELDKLAKADIVEFYKSFVTPIQPKADASEGKVYEIIQINYSDGSKVAYGDKEQLGRFQPAQIPGGSTKEQKTIHSNN